MAPLFWAGVKSSLSRNKPQYISNKKAAVINYCGLFIS